jgi:nitrite reductase/ring-hydroxylating ferredoxin subunit
MPVSHTAITRRSFLALLGRLSLWASGALSGVGFGRYLSYQPHSERMTVFDLGPASQYPPGSVTPIPEAHAMIVHTPDGLHAFSAICPHLGCEVGWEAGQFSCPCHGSRFSQDGSLINGPANSPLSHLALETDETDNIVLKLDG